MIDLNKGLPQGWLRDVNLKNLIEELNQSMDELLLYKEPTEAMKRTHRTIINEVCYRLNNLLGD